MVFNDAQIEKIKRKVEKKKNNVTCNVTFFFSMEKKKEKSSSQSNVTMSEEQWLSLRNAEMQLDVVEYHGELIVGYSIENVYVQEAASVPAEDGRVYKVTLTAAVDGRPALSWEKTFTRQDKAY